MDGEVASRSAAGSRPGGALRMLRCKNAVGCMEHPVSLIVGEASAAARAMSGDSCELPPPLRAFLAARRTLDDLLRLDHYQGRGEAARHQAAATAAWVESGRQGVAPVAAFADSLFAKVKAFPEVAAALISGSAPSAAHAAPPLDSILQRLEPVLQALRGLAQPAERQRISTQLLLECFAKLEPAAGAPDFRIDRYGLAVSPFAACPSPFAWHVDHRLPVACGGATDAANLECVQHRFNQCKRDSIIDPQLHGSRILGQMEPHTFVTAAQLQELAAALRAEGLEPSYQNVMALLHLTPPWSSGGSSSSGSGSSMAAPTEAARWAAGRRTRQEWSPEEEQALAYAAATHALAALSRGGRINWVAVAAEVGSGRTGRQCKDKWRGLLQHPDAGGEAAEAGEEPEEEPPQQQPPRKYRFWSEQDTGDAAQLLGAIGARLAADSSFAMTAPSFPAKLEAACHELWGVHLAERLPGHTSKQVVDKCSGMVTFALELALDKQLLRQCRSDRGLTPQQWQHLAPHLLRLADEVPLGKKTASLVASEAARDKVRRFVEDPPMQGEPDLPRLQDYWQPPQQAPVAGAVSLAAAARGAPDAAAPVPGQPASAGPATAAAASSLAEGIIDLTLSDSDDEGAQVAASKRPAAVACREHAAIAASSTAEHAGDFNSSSSGTVAATERPVLAAVQQPTGRREYRKLSDEGRERIRQLWLRHGSQWALIRREAEHDSIVSSWLAGRSRKQAQEAITTVARKWERAARQQERH